MTLTYGNLVIDICKEAPDGIVLFFPSYNYMEKIIKEWNEN